MPRNSTSSAKGWVLRRANQRAVRPPLWCAHCGDLATTIGRRLEPACAQCGLELATGKPPPMREVTGR